MTTYEYDGDKLVRAVTVHEPRFSDEDMVAALKRAEAVATTCPGCGMPAHEVMASEDQDRNVEIHSALKVNTQPCIGCQRLAEDAKRREPAPGVRTYLSWRDES